MNIQSLDRFAELVYEKLTEQDPALMLKLAMVAMKNMADGISLEPNQPAPDANNIVEMAAAFTKDMLVNAAEAIHQQMTELEPAVRLETTTTLTWK